MSLAFDPSDPDSFFGAIADLKTESDELINEIISEADKSRVDTFAFFSNIQESQQELADSQRNIHKGVKNVEERWSNTNNVDDRHKTYCQAIEFFKQTETTISKITKDMDKVIEPVSAPPI